MKLNYPLAIYGIYYIYQIFKKTISYTETSNVFVGNSVFQNKTEENLEWGGNTNLNVK
jgi:hypothetical protein